jgi:hypothetical protein
MIRQLLCHRPVPEWAGVMPCVNTNAGAVNAMTYVTADGRVGWPRRELQAAEAQNLVARGASIW